VAHNDENSVIDRSQFLRSYNFTEEQFKTTELDWSLLEKICDRHASMVSELQTSANYISQRLQFVPAVHSLNVRIKHGEHLIAKVVRKKLERPELVFEVASYEKLITDLIGIRALHLFKDEWRMIHDFITSTWNLHETPIAYVRSGDPKALITAFTDAKFKVEEHPFGYRSIHYIIETRPAKCTRFAELQIRTIFEEGWSEIDHRVRYPRQSDDPYLAEFLTIFNRLAGSADEMGTFIKSLSGYIGEQARKLAEGELEVAENEKALKAAVSKLEISEGEKNKLQSRIDELRRSSFVLPDLAAFSASFSANLLRGSDIAAFSCSALENAFKHIDVNALPNLTMNRLGFDVCANCGAHFASPPMSLSGVQLCAKCRKEPPTVKRLPGK
jgi:putative GTP pyrophosphokinase